MKKFCGLELLRFICSISVIIAHYKHFFIFGDVSSSSNLLKNYQTDLPFNYIIGFLYQNGSNAVQVFWGISGFIFCWKYADEISNKTVGARLFFVNRLSRLYPLHICSLLSVAFLQYIYLYINGTYFIYVHNDLYHFILNIFMAPGWGIERGYSYDAPIWSVSAEEISYASFFIVCAFRLNKFFQFVAIGMASFIILIILNRLSFPNSIIYCASYFFIGASIYRIDEIYTSKWLMFTISVISLIAAIAIFEWRVWLSFYPLTVFAVTISTTANDCFAKFRKFINFDALGNLTYSSYLLHFPLMTIFVIVTDSLGIGRYIYQEELVFLIYMSVVLITSSLSYKYLEHPAQLYLRKKLLHQRETAANTAAITRS